jgi:hypothetical protein
VPGHGPRGRHATSSATDEAVSSSRARRAEVLFEQPTSAATLARRARLELTASSVAEEVA